MSAPSSAEEVRRLDLGDMGWGEVLMDWYNPLIKRREIVLNLHHELQSTPMRILLRQKISEVMGVDVKRVYIRYIKTQYGVGLSRVRIHIYDSPEKALAFEPKYIIERNGGVDPFAEMEG